MIDHCEESNMGGGDKKPKMDNPDRERLVGLKRELEKERDGLAGASKRAAEDIGNRIQRKQVRPSSQPS